MRAVLDVFHKQAASERSSNEREARLSRGALLAAAAATAAAVAAAALLGSHSATASAEKLDENAPTEPLVPTKPLEHDVEKTLEERETALRSHLPFAFVSKLQLFPALVKLLRPKTNDDALLNAALNVEDCAEHLDVNQTSWLRDALLRQVCIGQVSGAACARVVARRRVLGLPDAADLDVSLLTSLDAVRHYVDAISADLVTFDRIVVIASRLVTIMERESHRTYASIIEIDRSLAAIALRCADKSHAETAEAISTEMGALVAIGRDWLPETMGVIVSAQAKRSVVGQGLAITLMTARFMVAAKETVPPAMLQGLRDELSVKREALGGTDNQESVLVADTIVFLAVLAEQSSDEANLLSFVKTNTLISSSLRALWQRHALVRKIVSNDETLLVKLLDDSKAVIDTVICYNDIEAKETVVDAAKAVIAQWPNCVSPAIERMGVRALKHYLDTIESVVDEKAPSTDMVRYCAALGRSGRRAKRRRKLDTDVLHAAWEGAPNSVLDAAKYWNVTKAEFQGKELLDLLVAGAKWGRYEHISKMTNLFGDWTPDEIYFDDPHARIVGAFFGLCERGEADGSSMARRWLCSESGTHDDAMVAFAFLRKADAITGALEQARSRGFSGIHGFLLVPGNGPTATSATVGLANSPGVLHAEKVALVASSQPADVVRAVRMTPWLVTFVDPTAIPMLMALITLVPECAAFLDNAQRAALKSDALFDSRRLSEDLSASLAIVVSVSPESQTEENARVLNALAGLPEGASEAPHSIDWPVPKENENEMGEADIRRMLSSAYQRGTHDADHFIRTHVIEPLRRESATNTRLFRVATELITEYNVLLASRKMDTWTVPVMDADTPRHAFGRKRQFV